MNNFILKLQLILAEKNNLFDDLTCPDCGCSNYINFREEKIRPEGLYYYCENCLWYDLISLDIIEESAEEFVNEHKFNIYSILYRILK